MPTTILHSPPLSAIRRRVTHLLLVLIRGYQRYISPSLPPHCRFYPTCSQYAVQAILWHGGLRGSWLTVRRLLRCHPWGGSGVDWVPRPLYRYRFYAVDVRPFSPYLVARRLRH